MSLIGITNLNSGATSSDVACEVAANTSSVELEELYTPGRRSKTNAEHKAAESWLPIVRRSIISYFAGCPEELYRMPSRDFEKLVAELMRNEGFDVSLTPETRDGGYDILAVRHQRITGDEVLLVECKRYAEDKKVSVGIVRSLIGVVYPGNATKGMLVTTSRLTGDARRLVEEESARLVAHDYEMLVEWLESISANSKRQNRPNKS